MPARRKRPDKALAAFHPIVRDWFTETLGAPSDPQRLGWPAIARGEHTLVLAPTGTGKTLAAFLWELDTLIRQGLDGPLPNGVHALYVSPLKALGNDVQRNLEGPLAELKARFERAGEAFPEIRVGVRTGDTPARERARMLRKSPHILITTPESLHILLTSVRGRGMFSTLRVVIVDEIHAMAGGKRGVHLALSLERLERLTERPAQRIGLSATQRPLDEVARFLGGCEPRPREADGAAFRPVAIVDCGLVKRLETEIRSPVPDLGNVGGTIWPSVAPLVLQRVRESRTTLVFVNNRAQAERMAGRVNTLAGEEIAQPYHGSLARERRLMLEQRLKAGELRALVTTSSLELGIDIGSVDLVIQLQSPKRVSAGLQRVGRAGHTLGATSRGVFVPTFRDDGLEILAIVDAMRDGDVEPTRVVQNALDVLAQVIVAAASVDDWTGDELYELVRRSYSYHRLQRAAFDETLAMLAGKYPADVAASLDAKVIWDRVSGAVSAPRGSRMAAVISGGTIPDRGLYAVTLPDRTRLGELDEEFVHETRIGDVFQLGSSTWRVGSIEHDRVIVTPAPGSPARMPFWHGEYGARSAHLTERVGHLRRSLDEARDRAALDALMQRYDADEATVQSMVEYVHQQRAATGVVPDERTLLLEHFRDETGSVRVVLHAPFGGRVNAPWGMAIAQRVREALGERARGASDDGEIDVQVQTTDDGIMIRMPDLGGPVPLGAFVGMPSAEAERRVLEEVGTTSLFGARFRMNAARALLLARGNPRRRMPLWLQRLKSLDLLQAVREFPSFPVLVETYRDVLQDAFDMPALARVLGDLERGEIIVRTVATEIPSPFAASLQFGFVMDWMYGDDVPRAERRAAMLSLDRALLQGLTGEAAPEDTTLAAIEEVLAARRGTAPGRRARSADELSILIDRAGDLTRAEAEARIATTEEGVLGEPLVELLAARRAIEIPVATGNGDEWRVILTETYPRYVAAFGREAMATVRCGVRLDECAAEDVVPELLRQTTLTRAAARHEILWRFLSISGPTSIADIRARYDFDAARLAVRIDEWERSGRLVRVASPGGEPRWAPRAVLELARRRELAAARRAVEAVELPVLAGFLQRWQHLDPRDRLTGTGAVARLIEQQSGLVRPADGWLRDYLPARLGAPEEASIAEALTRLVTSGEFVWAGSGKFDERSGAWTLSGVRWFARGTGSSWLREEPVGADALGSDGEKVRETLAVQGASFIGDLQAATGLGTRALRDVLRELVAAELATSDAAEAAVDVARWRALPPTPERGAPDPTRWLPEGFTPTRPVVQRRTNLRRLPKWRRPDLPGAGEREGGWRGRWSLLRTPGVLGAARSIEERAELVARQWLARYGIVSRDWWRRERPPVPWRAIYYELRKLELRGEVRRGYFVRGLAGAQFALPEAIEALRASANDPDAPLIAMRASDPANPYSLQFDEPRAAHERPRGRDAVLVTRAGRVLMSTEKRGRRLLVAPELSAEDVTVAARVLLAALSQGSTQRRDLVIETVDGVPATGSHHAPALARAGFRATPGGLRWYASLG